MECSNSRKNEQVDFSNLFFLNQDILYDKLNISDWLILKF